MRLFDGRIKGFFRISFMIIVKSIVIEVNGGNLSL